VILGAGETQLDAQDRRLFRDLGAGYLIGIATTGQPGQQDECAQKRVDVLHHLPPPGVADHDGETHAEIGRKFVSVILLVAVGQPKLESQVLLPIAQTELTGVVPGQVVASFFAGIENILLAGPTETEPERISDLVAGSYSPTPFEGRFVATEVVTILPQEEAVNAVPPEHDLLVVVNRGRRDRSNGVTGTTQTTIKPQRPSLGGSGGQLVHPSVDLAQQGAGIDGRSRLDSRLDLGLHDAVDLEVAGLVPGEAPIDLRFGTESCLGQDDIGRRLPTALGERVVVEVELIEVNGLELGITLQDLELSPLGVVVGNDDVEVGLAGVGQRNPLEEIRVELDVLDHGDAGHARLDVDNDRITSRLDVVVSRQRLGRQTQKQSNDQTETELFQSHPP